MKPDLRQEHQRGWIAVAASVVLALLGLWITWSWVGGGTPNQEAFASAKADYERRNAGIHQLQDQLLEAERGIVLMQDQVEDLKSLTGIQRVSPFLVPANAKQLGIDGFFFNAVFATIREEGFLMAGERRTDIRSDSLGFVKHGQVPPKFNELQDWLTMLQLVSKAMFLCLNVDSKYEPFSSVTILPLDIANIKKTGPAGRPPLMREYPFSIRVNGTLRSIRWLLHQLSLDDRTQGSLDPEFNSWLKRISQDTKDSLAMDIPVNDGGISVGPLILRGLTISSQTFKPDDTYPILEATFDLAGMEYLSHQERGTKPYEPSQEIDLALGDPQKRRSFTARP